MMEASRVGWKHNPEAKENWRWRVPQNSEKAKNYAVSGSVLDVKDPVAPE